MRRKAATVVVFLGLLLLTPLAVSAQSFEVLNRNAKIYQSGVVMVKLASHLKDKNLKLYIFDELYSFNKNNLAFIPVEVGKIPGEYKLYLVDASDGSERTQYDFYYTFIEILNKEFGTPWYAGPIRKRDKAAEGQRAKEIQIIHNAYAQANLDEDYTSGQFVTPLDNPEVTDQFGTLRLYGTYNKRTRKTKIEMKVSHGGVDLRAKTPLPVMTINSGKVLLARYFPLRGTEGNLLVIDHGSGILSLYLHLSRFKVKVGDKVKKGQVVALSGASPKGTPPHLHLMVKIHGVNVDPLAFINDFNKFVDR